jgi:hypothetical protein
LVIVSLFQNSKNGYYLGNQQGSSTNNNILAKLSYSYDSSTKCISNNKSNNVSASDHNWVAAFVEGEGSWNVSFRLAPLKA